MNINPTLVKISTRNVKTNEKRLEGGQQHEMRHSSLKEWEQKVYPFLDVDMPEMLEQLLKLKLIELWKLENVLKTQELFRPPN